MLKKKCISFIFGTCWNSLKYEEILLHIHFKDFFFEKENPKSYYNNDTKIKPYFPSNT